MAESFDQQHQKARNYCFRLLQVRPRSCQEIRQRLKQKKYPLAIINKTMARLLDVGLLDDNKFTRDWTTWRMANGYGKHRIAAELKLKGIAEATIASVIDQAVSGYDEESVARALAQKRSKRYANLEPSVGKRRLYGFLVRKGFSQTIVLKIIQSYDNI